jgi:hypothetical protein
MDSAGRGPREGLGVLIVMFDELIDLALQIGHRVERAATDRLICNERKPAFDLVQPRAISGREVQMEAHTPGKPRTHLRVFVSSGVVADQMHIEVLRKVRLDVPQEAQELLMPMLCLALGEDATIGDIKRREQRRGAMANVAVGDAFDIAQTHRQQGLRALQRLHWVLLIDAQHQGMIRRVQIQADDIAHLFDEERIIRELKAKGEPSAFFVGASQLSVADLSPICVVLCTNRGRFFQLKVRYMELADRERNYFELRQALECSKLIFLIQAVRAGMRSTVKLRDEGAFRIWRRVISRGDTKSRHIPCCA